MSLPSFAHLSISLAIAFASRSTSTATGCGFGTPNTFAAAGIISLTSFGWGLSSSNKKFHPPNQGPRRADQKKQRTTRGHLTPKLAGKSRDFFKRSPLLFTVRRGRLGA